MPNPPTPSAANTAATEPGGALAGLRVLDLSRVLAGPYCAQLLADHGADVIKVEPPAGDETRGWGPPFVAPDTSAYYRNLNRAKKNIVVDLSAPEGRDILDALLRDADVLVENFKAGTLAKWGYADEDLRHRHPALIHCRITGFGTGGPLGGQPGYDAVLQAYGGLMSVNGEHDGPPLRVGVPVVDQVTGVLAFSGILLALHERHRSGLGQLVDCTLLDTAVSLLHPHSASYLADGTVPRRTGSAHPSIAPYDSFAAADGPVFIAVGNDRQFRALADVLALPGLVEDPRFRTNADRVRHQGELRAALEEAIAGHDRAGLTALLTARGIPASPVHDVAEALTAPQTRHRGLVVESDGYRGLAPPVSLSRTPARVRPEVRGAGADTRDVLAAAGFDAEFVDEAAERGVVRLAEPPPGRGDG